MVISTINRFRRCVSVPYADGSVSERKLSHRPLSECVLNNQVLLNFSHNAAAVRVDISAITRTPDGYLWVASDEVMTIERLSETAPGEYGDHQQYAVADYVDLQDTCSEIDIEGMDFSDGYLWLIGSHSTKRKGLKGKDAARNVRRLLKIETDCNRYLLVRIPIVNGVPVKHDLLTGRMAACLPSRQNGLGQAGAGQKGRVQSELTEALWQDEHIGLFLQMGLPAKENGFDIEALAVRGDQMFLGLRGPVIGGMAIVLEVSLKAKKSGSLKLKALKNKQRYRKHFVDLNGLGIRDLCFQGEDLIILTGPTMPVACAMQVFRWQNAAVHVQEADAVWRQADGGLTHLFDLPLKSENAEGICLFSCCNGKAFQENRTTQKTTEGLAIAYDSPHAARLKGDHAIFVDVFQL